MTSYPPGLLEHLKSAVTTLCYCWKLTLKDGTVCGFTDHDQRVSIGGTEFQPQSGFSASEARKSLGLSTDTVDVEGALSSTDIREEDIDAGLYDDARVETWLVNWSQPNEAALLGVASIGRIIREDGLFRAEMRNLGSSFDKPSGRYFHRHCDASLGDERCKVDTSQPELNGSGQILEVRASNVLIVNGLDNFEEGWFQYGVLTWTSGENQGDTARIIEHRFLSGITRIVTERPAVREVTPGDAFTVIAGCNKSFATCKAKFLNQENFRGFPHMPGNDAAYGYASPDQVFDGSPLIP